MKSIHGSGAAGRTGVSDPSTHKDEAHGGTQSTLCEHDDLKRVEAALRRLDSGIFGHCLYCGDQISVKRLDMDPAIDSCATCDEG